MLRASAGNCCLRLCLLAILLFWRSGPCLGTGDVNGFINFAQPTLIVDEGPAAQTFTSVSIPLVREGGTTGTVFATITILGATDSDFLGTNVAVVFGNGATEASATVVVRNDAVPEGNETFTVEISGARFGAEVGDRSTMQLIIRANDEPFGAFQFDTASLTREVSEPATGESSIQLTVVRGPGVFGRVTIDYEIQDNSGLDDLTPSQGQLVFEDQVASQILTLSVLSDNLPEPDEVFLVQLTRPGGGATLATSNTRASVTILANDSPLRFSQALVEADESGGSVQLTILRGQLEDGSSAGDLNVPTTVQLSTTAGSAMSSVDFNPLSLTINFPVGSTSQTVSISIVDDSIPEGDEQFTVELSSPSADAVLIPASTATVIIPINDNAGGLVAFESPGPILIQEDDQTTAQFVIQRTVGNLGDITVEWEITNTADGSIATSDFQPPRGNVTIPNGQSQVILALQATDDSLPEVAEGFMVRLVRVAQGEGELSETGIRLASLIVAESDYVYGQVEWAESDSLTVTSTASSRNLQLAITRGGGSVGTIAVDYSIVYLPPGVSDPLLGSSGIVVPAVGSVQIQDSQSSLQFNVPLMSGAFLEEGSSFYVTLDNTTLVGGATPLVPAVNSPSLGNRRQAVVPVPASALNGIISFAFESLQVNVEEPVGFPSLLRLTLTRTGSFGAAVITWVITPVNADLLDIEINTGTATFASGSNTTQLEIFISPDDEPEIDEIFSVTLVTVSPNSQRINPDLNMAFVTILENDDAAGIFSIAAISQGPLFIEETPTSVLQITIARSRGALTNVVLQYNIPGAENEIIGGIGLVNFVPGQTENNVSLLINDDNIPETNETYTFSISSVDGNTAILGSPTSVAITVLANDDYAGLFQFASGSSIAIIAEPPSNPSDQSTPSSTTLTVTRGRGTFTDVTVSWQVTTLSAALDVTPTLGILDFTEGQTTASFQITALPDQVPEGNETLTVQLTGVSGDGRLAAGSQAQASLTVLHNDDPVRFAQSVVIADEGNTALLTINRGGQANGDVQVTFEVIYTTASANDVTITPAPIGGVVNFVDGQSSATISVEVLDDSIPEMSEILTFRLVSVTGDAVLVTPTEATLQVSPNDDPNGVFQFNSDSSFLSVQEGDSVDLLVERSAGDFGTVDLRWTIWLIQDSLRTPADSLSLFPTMDIITFGPGNRSAVISFNIIDDLLPELAEMYEVELSIFNIVGETDDGASIGETNTSVIIVQESDDPYGLLSIRQTSADIEIAEDIPDDNPNFGMANIEVERMRGTIGDIRVLWEVLPEDVVLPSFVDLLFLGNRGTLAVTAAGRPDTGTEALAFTASNGVTGLVTVPPQFYPDVSGSFAISIWMQSDVISNGVLLAKAMEGSSLFYYRVSLVADSSDYLFQFSFLPESTSTQRNVEVSFSQSQLPTRQWHSLCVVVNTGSVRFYTNGVFRGSRSIGSTPLADGSGQLTVGGTAAGNFFSGTLQDVRVYSASLSASQVSAIAADEATASVTPISGYVDFSASVSSSADSSGTQTLSTISFFSKDDSIPEPSEIFTVYLANSDGGSRINPTQNTAQVTVLKSDGNNGVFGFDEGSSSAIATEPGTASLLVNREAGLLGSVLVAWEIYQINNGVISSTPAVEDFDPAAGVIMFEEGEMQQELRLVLADELVPELQEEFVVMLVTAVANDSEVSSTPFSGAYINTTISQSTVTVRENDYPYGLFQFATSTPAPGISITPATVMPQLTVRESDGTVTVYVVRAQGTVGTVSVEYFTSDGSATSQGLDPDFTPSAGRLDFSGDTVVGSFQVNLLDDNVAELGKTFYINLTNPQGDVMTPSLSDIGSVLAVNIEPSDDAFGRFGFNVDSQSLVVTEQTGGTPVVLTVMRQGGQFGDVSVYWSVSQSGNVPGSNTDISPLEGVLEFAEGDNQMSILLTVNDDLEAELLEVFTVRLVNATAGASLGPVSVSTITVEANDHPYGRFVFVPSYRPLLGNNEGSDVEIVVTREFGTLGEVTVDFMSIASTDVLTAPALAGVVDVQQLIDSSQVAETGLDYSTVNGRLVFGDGVTSQSFNLSLLQDVTPEIDEYIFIAITNVQLNESSVDVVDSGALPFVAPGNDSVAFVVISENDDARGVVQLSSGSVQTSEPSQEFISVTREAGTFGEIIVQWETVPGSATADDYNPTRGVVTLAEGVLSAPVPLSITEETVPEFSEQFTVRLVGVVGGARLGALRSATVTITASDNPNGAIQFAADDRSVEVNEGSTQTALSLTVERVGGAVGVVQVMWNLTRSNGGDPSDDILPTAGSLQFITNNRQQTITLTILPDDLPEVDESFVVHLTSATGGAALVDNTQAVITILANDNPFGIISLQSPSAVTMEIGDNGTSIALIPVIRELGMFGNIRVNYSIQSASAADLALAVDGVSLFDYFTSPITDFTLMPSAILRFEVGFTLQSCATACLSDQACLSFAHDVSTSLCQLYLTTMDGTNSVFQTGPVYYEKLQAMVLPFYRGVATGDSDFITAIGESVIIPAGSNVANIPVTIFGDATPELNESLVITVTGLEVVTSDDVSMSLPFLGNITSTTLTILENDDPHGLFVVYSSGQATEIYIGEPDTFSFGVMLSVERSKGTFGDVSVRWNLEDGTAVENFDYAGTGMELRFSDGESRTTVALTILGDEEPEIDEDFFVTLTNPTGGARVASGNEGRTRIVIKANDGAAGVVGLAPLSRSTVVGEGESATLTLLRDVSTFGAVEVEWLISSTSGNASQEFVTINDIVRFEEGENETQFIVSVRADSTPETEERYTLNLVAIDTISDVISPSGVAVFDQQGTTSSITIRASNNPHGVVQFQQTSLSARSQEGMTIEFTIIREFGTFGTIRVVYQARAGNVNDLTAGQSLATAGTDFSTVPLETILDDGQQSAVITMDILEDDVPELEEVFVVELTSVSLVSGDTTGIPPSLGANTVAEVIIAPNDSPQGIITFPQETEFIMEGIGSVGVTVSREQGAFGQVSAIYFVSGGTAVLGQDFTVADALGVVVFEQDQDSAVININIVNDNIPEVDEEFCIQLRLPQGGATLGNLTMTCVTILPNDDPYGVFRFDDRSISTTISEPQGATSTGNVAQLTVVRDRGLFEQVTVPFEIRQLGSQQVASPVDLTPTMGALVFSPNDQTRIIQIEALMDDIPETDEVFFVTLLPPPQLGRLSETATTATITIQANQNPFGVLELSAVGVTGSQVSVEEDMDRVEFELTRSFGTFGDVSIFLDTIPGTAISTPGMEFALDPLQSLNTSSADLWYAFSTAFGRRFLALVSGSQAVLYGWRGIYVPITTLTANSPSGFTYVSPSSGVDLLVVANRGSSANREINSLVYRFTQLEQLSLVQSIPTQGASDVVSFNIGGVSYIVISNSEDNDANPNVDTIVYRWGGTSFVQFQMLSTIGASALATFSYRGELNLVVASLTDTRSSVYAWINGRFRLDHNFASQRATDVAFLSLSGTPHLAVSSETTGVSLLRMSESTGQFVFNQSLSSSSAVKVEVPSDIMSVAGGDFVTFPPTFTTEAPSTTDVPSPLTTIPVQMTTAAQVQTTVELISTTEEVLFPQTTQRPSTQAPPTTLPPTTRPPTTPPPTTPPPTTVPPTTVPPMTTEDPGNMVITDSDSKPIDQLTTVVEVTMEPTTPPPTTPSPTTPPPTTPPPTTPPPTTPPPTTPPPTTPPPTTPPPTTPPPTTPPPTTLPPTTVPPITTEDPGNMVITDSDGKPIDPQPEMTTVVEVTMEPTTPPPTTQPPVTTEDPDNMVITDSDGKPIDPLPEMTTFFEMMLETTIPPEPQEETTIPPEPQEETTEAPMTTSPETTTPSAAVTTLPPVTTVDMGPTEKPTDYGGDGGDYGYDDESDPGNRRRRRRNAFGAQPPSTDVDTELLVITNSQGAGQMFAFSNGVPTELTDVSVPTSSHLYLYKVENSTFMAAAGILQGQPVTETSIIYGIESINPQNTDYFERGTVLTLRSGESSLCFDVGIFDDNIPEIDENFELQISTPVGGVVLGTQQSITITIQNNDDAYGLVGFAEASLSVVAPELDMFSTVNLDVIREAGLFGHVTVTWELTGDHSEGEVTPSSGIVVFPEGVSMATITLVFQPDTLPELNEVTTVRLTSATVQRGGMNQPQLISGRQEAVITVEANDSPHGVVSWSPIFITATETNSVDNTIQLTLVREFGTIGAVVISYSTLVNSSLPSEERAEPLMDFVPTTSEVVIGDGQSSTTISLTILHDNTPETDESFLVNITGVRLASEADREGSMTDSPRLLEGGEIATVQIGENDNSRGVVNVAFTSAIVNEEPSASITLELVRTRGTFGTVGVDYVVRAGTASLQDISEATASGTVQIMSGQERTTFDIDIFNDAIPEPDEMFTVELVSASDGVQLGNVRTIEVTILANDDINGVFSFSNTSLLLLVSESDGSDDPVGMATLTVERSTSFVGEVVVYWEVSIDGLDDLEPSSGNLTFADGVRQQQFQVRAVDDGIPELFEAFAISLVSADGGGRITDPREARVAIRSSNDPNGVVSLQQFPDGILVEEGSELIVDMFRSAGTVGTVTATWEITPPDSAIFVTLTDNVVFTDGQTRASIRVQTLTDQTPEIARQFTLRIVSTSFAGIDVNASEVLVIVPASNNPHGLVEFDQTANQVQLSEDVGSIVLDLQRTQGVIGTLRVNYTVLLLTASSDDFSISSNYAIIPDGSATGNITIAIVDDDVAELEERFSIRLTSVEVIGDAGRDFITNLDPSLIDEPPSVGPSAAMTVVILPSDDPYGMISLAQARYDVVEGDTLMIPVVRVGGSLATVSVQYSASTTNRGATLNDDFEVSSGILIFLPGEDMKQILVTIVDDTNPETEETFEVFISNPTLATLGSVTMTTIFIDANDSPFGTIGFDQTALSGTRITNPTVQDGPRSISLTVVRSPGANGQSVETNINWSVRRNPAGGSAITEDIAVSTISGVLTIGNGQLSSAIVIIVLPSSGDEVEEMFTVTLNSASSNVFLDSTRSQASITVEQVGSPFGEISFLGEALAGIRTNEQNTNSTISFAVARSGDLLGTSQVFYTVSRIGSSDPVSLDVLPSSGSFLFPAGVGQASLQLMILADDVSEMDETFTVVLTGSTGGATINLQASSATFVIASNDAPYGEYGVSNVALNVMTVGQIISRTLNFDITRMRGNVGTTQVTVNITLDQDPMSNFVTRQVVRSFSPDQTTESVSLPVNQDAFLPPGAIITLTVVRAEVTLPADIAGNLGDATAPAQLVIAESVANPIIFFDQRSLIASVNDSASVGGNVMLTVNRRGQLGTVEVTWSATTIPGSSLAIGSTTPVTNSFRLTSTNTTAQISLTATPIEPHGTPEAFAVQLSATSQTPMFAAGVDSAADLAIIEEWGVVQLGGSTLTGLEGGMVAVPVWRRYGSRGAIQVTGVALQSSSSAILPGQIPAQAGVDFPTSPLTITLQDGETIGFINVPLTNNSVMSAIKAFTFQLTSVARVSNPGFPVTSPRLSTVNTLLTAQVSIIDDEGGAGLFQLNPTSATVQEGSQFTFSVARIQGRTGQLSVQLQTQANGLATAGADFVPLNQELVFGDGETTKTLTVSIIDDDVSEEAEGFSVALIEPPGGAAIIDPLAQSLDLTIAASDNPGGVFYFLTPSLALSEDLVPSGILQVRRDSQAVGLFGRVEVAWEALYVDGGTHPVSLNTILVNSRGTLVFAAGQTLPQTELLLQLNPNSVPPGGEQFVVRLSSVIEGEIGLGVPSEVTVSVQPRTVAVFQISQENLMMVVSSPGRIFINIERTNGLALATQVIYNTTQPTQNIDVGQISFQPALAQRHFTSTQTPVIFASNQASRSVDVNIISVPDTPAAFQVMVSSQTHNVTAGSAVVVLVSDSVLGQLYSIFFVARNVTTSQQLNNAATSLFDLLNAGGVSGQVQNHSDTLQATISTLISKSSSIDFSSTDYVNTMLNVFHRIASDITFEGHSQFVQLMKEFAYSLVASDPCTAVGGGQPRSHTRTSFYMEAVKLLPSSLSGRRFSSSPDDNRADYVEFPRTPISVATSCVSVHFIEFFTENLFVKPTLRSKVLSVGVDSEGIDLFPSADQLIYRIYTDHSLGLLPDEDDCLFWQYPVISAGVVTPGSWGTSMCQPQSHFVNLENYITCTCRQLGDLAAANVVGVGYGWTFPAAITAAIVIVAMLLVILVHLCYLSRTQLATKILINLCISVGIFQLFLLINILAGDSPNVSANGCAALGGLLQYTVLVQFVWILVLGVALWINFMGFTDGREPLIFYILASWCLPIIIVVITILIWQFGVNRPLTELYGQRYTGEICFMPVLSASLLSTALPVILALLVTVALLSHSCVYWSRWEDYHNIYHDSFNKVEIPLLIGLFAIISLSAVTCYLHAYITVVYTFAIFCIMNVIEAVYAIVVYCFISWHTLTRKHKYGLEDEVEPLSIPGEPDYLSSVSTLASAQHDLSISKPTTTKRKDIEMDDMFEKDSDASSQVGQGQHGIMTLGVRQFSSSDASLPPRGTSPSPGPDGEDSNLDDLMFMLKTQNYDDDDDDTVPLTSPQKRERKGEEHLELRRISIADTHL